MRSYLAAFVIAAAVASVLTPLVRWMALRYGIVATGSRRDVHRGSVPRLGGVAICLALFPPVVGILFVESAVAAVFNDHILRVVGLCAGGVAMCVLGVVDDVRGLRAIHKLLFQTSVAVFAYFCGFRIEAVVLPFIGELSMGIFALPVTVLWIIGIVNAVNLIDGLDGLAAGVVFFAGLTNFTVAYINGGVIPALIMASLLGAVLGFLLYNFNPARIFMGDSGSYLLGFVIAVTALVGNAQKASTAVSLLVPVVALGVPIFDTLFSIVRRYLERRPIFSPDRGHVHHRLLDMGITHKRAVLILYGVSCVFTVAAIAIYLGRSWQVGVALLIASVVVLGLGRFVGTFSLAHLRKRQLARVRSRETERLRHLVPDLKERLAKRSESELLQELVTIAEEAQFVALRVEVGSETRLDWTTDDRDDRRTVATMGYPLGPDRWARAKLVVSVVNEFEEPQMLPESDILLQVLADVVTQALVVLKSPLAPQVSLPPEADESAEGLGMAVKTRAT